MPKQKRSPVAIDPFLDATLGLIGISPESLEQFLTGHKDKARLTVNMLSLARIVIGYLAIQQYEKAREAEDKKQMALTMVIIGLVLATDAFDGYISRKAQISESTSGKVLDSVSDVALRAMLAKSSLAEKDKLAVLRGIGEVLVATDALPDIINGTYKSTGEGKLKVSLDTLAIVAGMVKDIVPGETSTEASLKVLHDIARTVSTGLAITDGVKRIAKKTQTNE